MMNDAVNANFWGDEVPKENVHHTCIACITFDSVMKVAKKSSTSLFRRTQV